jgi:hypothetical protein
MEAIIVGLIGAASALLVQGIGYYFNRKSGLAPVQEAYQDTLEGMNKALGQRITELEYTVSTLTQANDKLTEKVSDLESEVRRLTRENYDMARELLKVEQNRGK